MIDQNATLNEAPTGHATMDRTPALARVLSTALGGVLALAGAASVVIAVLGVSQGAGARGVYWAGILGAVACYAGVTALLTGLGKYKTGPALAVFIAGGTGLACGVLVDPSIATRLIGRGGSGTTIAGVQMVYVGAAMLTPGLLLLATSAVAVLGRSWSMSIKPLALGVVWLVPALIALAYPLPMVGGVARSILNAIGSAPAVLTPVLYLIVGGVVCISIAVGGGLVIRALEQGIGAGLKPKPDAKASPASA